MLPKPPKLIITHFFRRVNETMFAKATFSPNVFRTFNIIIVCFDTKRQNGKFKCASAQSHIAQNTRFGLFYIGIYYCIRQLLYY